VSPPIEVWRVDLVREADEVRQRFARVLAPDEHERARRFAHPDHASRWIVARGALRMLLGRRLNMAPGDVQLGIGSHGKPELRGTGRATLRFNLSHSGGLALIAMTDGQEVGVDVEPTTRSSALIINLLTEAERSLTVAIRPADRHVELLRVWCRKEALAKAIGVGLAPGPAEFDTQGTAGYHLRDLDPGPGFVAALASQYEPTCVVERAFNGH
jgi:4'-phosphopantetheinyl transferase